MNSFGGGIRHRLCATARSRGIPTQAMLDAYSADGFLRRLSQYQCAPTLILKGDHLLNILAQEVVWPISQLDLHIDSLPSAEEVAEVLGKIAASPCDDGIQFGRPLPRPKTRLRRRSKGVCTTIQSQIGQRSSRLGVNVVLGSPIHPGPEQRWYDGMFDDSPSTLVPCATAESMIAEKLAYVVEFGNSNTRLSDYMYIYHLILGRNFKGRLLQEAVISSLAHSEIERHLFREDGSWLLGFSEAFVTSEKEDAWDRLRSTYPHGRPIPDFRHVLKVVRLFATPLLLSIRDGFSIGRWSTDGKWEGVRAREMP
jgi:hypothetical protein